MTSSAMSLPSTGGLIRCYGAPWLALHVLDTEPILLHYALPHSRALEKADSQGIEDYIKQQAYRDPKFQLPPLQQRSWIGNP